jgi:O-acetyl-ADP-ribose deacetylase
MFLKNFSNCLFLSLIFSVIHNLFPVNLDFMLHHNDPEWLEKPTLNKATMAPSINRFTYEISGITFHIVKKDITLLTVDVIVNAANRLLARGGGVCGVIFEAAEGNSQTLQKYITDKHPNGIEPGQAIITPSFNLEQCGIQHIIHTAGPIYHRYVDKNEAADVLRSCYRESFRLAAEYKENSSIAFPFIASGIYGFPKEEAAKIALETLFGEIKKTTSIKTIYFSLIHQEDIEIFKKILEQNINPIS